MLALVSSSEEPEWPDFLDIETGYLLIMETTEKYLGYSKKR